MAKENKFPPRFYRVVDRNLRSFGQIDFARQVIKLNPKKGDMINTIIHEDLHAEFPDKSEKWIQKEARKKESKLTVAQAQQLLEKFRAKNKRSTPHYKTD